MIVMTLTTLTEKREEARDKIAVLQRQEATTYRRPLPTFGSDKKHWRQSIVEWMYSVVDNCGMQRDVVAVAVYYLDATPVSTREEYQLCAMTALELALKLYDSVSLKWTSLVRLGRGAFSEDDIRGMEIHILNSLQWRMHPPTSICFLQQYLHLLPDNVDVNSHYRIEQVSRFVFEFASCLSIFSQYPPSHLAYAGMCVAMQRMDASIVSGIHDSMEAYTGIMFQEIVPVWRELQKSLEHNVSLHELLVSIDARCAPFRQATESPLAVKHIIQLGSSPRQVSG